MADPQQNQPTTTVPIFDPSGNLGDIPQEQLAAAVKAGAKPGVHITAPDGSPGVIPADRTADAVKQGAKLLPIEEQPIQHPGVWGGIYSTLKGLGLSLPQLIAPSILSSTPVGTKGGGVTIPGMESAQQNLKGLGAQQQYAQNMPLPGGDVPVLPGGVSPRQLYRGVAPLVPGSAQMEQSAREGDVGGVYGTAGTVAALTAAPLGIKEAYPAVSEAVSPVVKPAMSLARRAYGIADPTVMTAVESVTRALKPRNALTTWKDNAASALPDVKRAANALGIDPMEQGKFANAQAGTLQAKKDVWQELKQNYLDPNADITVDTGPVARTIRSVIDDRTVEQNPALAERINQVADTYENRQLSVAQLEDRLQAINNQTRAIQARYPNDRMAAMQDPENAYVFAEKQSLNNLLTSTLDEAAGPGATALKQRYGALKQFSDVLDRRKNVWERQNPESLAEQGGNIYGVGQMARGAGRILFSHDIGGLADIGAGYMARKAAQAGKMMNSSEFLLQQAFDKTSPRPAMVPRVSPQYIPLGQPPALPSGPNQALPPGVYQQPSGFETPQANQLPPFAIRGLLPRGVYEQPGTSINQPALPPYRGIPLPETFKRGPVSRYTRAEGEVR